MKQTQDKFTRDAITTVKVGCFSKVNTKTQAQRAKEYRLRQKAKKFNFLNSQNSL